MSSDTFEKYEKLIEKFSHLFPSDFYFEVGFGWYDIVHALLEGLSGLVSSEDQDCVCFHERSDHLKGKCSYKYEEDGLVKFACGCPKYTSESLRVLQIKEKFGGLRIYVSQETPESLALIKDAEQRASKTCEYCGKPGELVNNGWAKTLCPTCTPAFSATGHSVMMEKGAKEDGKP